MLRTQVLSEPNAFAKLAEPWRELVRTAPSATPFQTFEWQNAWWRHFGRSKRLRLLACYEGQDLVGVMPLSVVRGPWSTLRASGGGPSDYLHPLSAAGFESSVADAVAEYLPRARDIDLVDLHQLREDRSLAGRYEGDQRLEQAKCLVLELPESFDAYLSGLSKSLRYDVRRMEKDLFKSGKAKFVSFSADDLDRGLDWLFETHRMRWRKRGLPGAFLGRQEKFHREWAREAQANQWLWLTALVVDERPIGSIYAMRVGATCYYYQAGFDPGSSSISPGTLLVAHTIRRAIDEGCERFDFLRGDEPYKRRWKPQRVLSNLRILTANTAAGRIGMRWNGVGNRVEMRVRARLEGRGLI